MKAEEVPLRLIPLQEEEEINRPLLLAKKMETFRTRDFFMSKKDLRFASAKPITLDPLTMDKDRDFYGQLTQRKSKCASSHV